MAFDLNQQEPSYLLFVYLIMAFHACLIQCPCKVAIWRWQGSCTFNSLCRKGNCSRLHFPRGALCASSFSQPMSNATYLYKAQGRKQPSIIRKLNEIKSRSGIIKPAAKVKQEKIKGCLAGAQRGTLGRTFPLKRSSTQLPPA